MKKYDKTTNCTSKDQTIVDIMDRYCTIEEVDEGITKLKGKTICGLDGIPAEMFKAESNTLVYPLCTMFNYVLDKGEIV